MKNVISIVMVCNRKRFPGFLLSRVIISTCRKDF